ncbi:hypothetical protein EDD22DRAFT_952197 [Suillus occidentalis]|nr:hypothetical protein EDD22DRAFT_952197 [Suillus occidentalis]
MTPLLSIHAHNLERFPIHASTNGLLSAAKDKGKERDDSSASAQSPPSDGRTPTRLHSKDNRNSLKRLLQSRGNNLTFGSSHSSTRPANAPKQVLHDPTSSFPAGPSRRPVEVAACRGEDRYGITPETDAEAAAAKYATSEQ